MAAVAFARRMFGGGAPSTTVPGGIGLTDASNTLASGTNWPSGGSGFFYAVADLGNSNEEKILCASTVGNLLTYVAGGRGADGTAAAVHQPGCTIKVCHVAQDDDEANHMVNILGNAAVGSLFVGGGTAVVPSTLAVGATGSLLQVVGGTPAWLAVGTAAQFLQGGTNPAWLARNQQLLYGKDTALDGGSPPAAGTGPFYVQTGYQAVTFSGGAGTLTWPTAFPNGVLGCAILPYFGAAYASIIGLNGTASKTSAPLYYYLIGTGLGSGTFNVSYVVYGY